MALQRMTYTLPFIFHKKDKCVGGRDVYFFSLLKEGKKPKFASTSSVKAELLPSSRHPKGVTSLFPILRIL